MADVMGNPDWKMNVPARAIIAVGAAIGGAALVVYTGPCIYYGACITALLASASLDIFDSDGVTSNRRIDLLPAGAAIGTHQLFSSGIECAIGIQLQTGASGRPASIIYYRPIPTITGFS